MMLDFLGVGVVVFFGCTMQCLELDKAARV